MFVKSLKTLSLKDTKIAGGKGASLGEMIKERIPIPPGFVVLTHAFEKFLDKDCIKKYNAEKIRGTILKTKFPEELGKEILKSFDKLGVKYVAVRSSASCEDSKKDAWAGQLESYLYVTRNVLLKRVQNCWMSLYSSRALSYKKARKLEGKDISMAVVIQEMINSDVSGICFTIHPMTLNRNHMLIEACWGLGELLVRGAVNPDSYVVEKKTFNLIDTNISLQKEQLIGKVNKCCIIAVSKNKQGKQKLKQSEIIKLAKMCDSIEKHYGKPQDIEWVLKKGKFYIVQSRPITTFNER
ncbi:MAG: PEP/pyruvate-binding domain-containing protein [bacterium]|nr:PEP/pyruvate-binding domain-containing protein [bacterium]